jgi:hypothetical protein
MSIHIQDVLFIVMTSLTLIIKNSNILGEFKHKFIHEFDGMSANT